MTQPAQQLACNGQPGVAKPGTDRLVYMGIGAVEAILAELTEGIGAIAAAAWFAGKSYDLLHICGNPDPGDPGMTTQDWVDLLDYTNPSVNIPAGQKAIQWFEHVMWPVWCNCTDGTAPPANTPTGPPPNQPNPNSPPGTVGPNCWTAQATRTITDPHGLLVFTDLLPNVATRSTPDVPNTVGIQTPAPASITVTYSVAPGGTNDLDGSLQFAFYNATGQLVPGGFTQVDQVLGAPAFTHNMPIPTAAVNWGVATIAQQGTSTPSTSQHTVSVTVYCSGQSPTSVNTPCCPPDPSVDLRLGALMDMVTQLLSLQALQGRYQDTIRHAGLSGEGTISINPASSGVRIEIKTDLSTWPNHPQTPTYYLSLGFITPFAVGTPLRGQRIIYNNQTFTWPSYTDSIGYTLASGLTIDLVELTRGA